MPPVLAAFDLTGHLANLDPEMISEDARAKLSEWLKDYDENITFLKECSKKWEQLAKVKGLTLTDYKKLQDYLIKRNEIKSEIHRAQQLQGSEAISQLRTLVSQLRELEQTAIDPIKAQTAILKNEEMLKGRLWDLVSSGDQSNQTETEAGFLDKLAMKLKSLAGSETAEKKKQSKSEDELEKKKVQEFSKKVEELQAEWRKHSDFAAYSSDVLQLYYEHLLNAKLALVDLEAGLYELYASLNKDEKKRDAQLYESVFKYVRDYGDKLSRLENEIINSMYARLRAGEQNNDLTCDDVFAETYDALRSLNPPGVNMKPLGQEARRRSLNSQLAVQFYQNIENYYQDSLEPVENQSLLSKMGKLYDTIIGPDRASQARAEAERSERQRRVSHATEMHKAVQRLDRFKKPYSLSEEIKTSRLDKSSAEYALITNSDIWFAINSLPRKLDLAAYPLFSLDEDEIDENGNLISFNNTISIVLKNANEEFERIKIQKPVDEKLYESVKNVIQHELNILNGAHEEKKKQIAESARIAIEEETNHYLQKIKEGSITAQEKSQFQSRLLRATKLINKYSDSAKGNLIDQIDSIEKLGEYWAGLINKNEFNVTKYQEIIQLILQLDVERKFINSEADLNLENMITLFEKVTARQRTQNTVEALEKLRSAIHPTEEQLISSIQTRLSSEGKKESWLANEVKVSIGKKNPISLSIPSIFQNGKYLKGIDEKSWRSKFLNDHKEIFSEMNILGSYLDEERLKTKSTWNLQLVSQAVKRLEGIIEKEKQNFSKQFQSRLTRFRHDQAYEMQKKWIEELDNKSKTLTKFSNALIEEVVHHHGNGVTPYITNPNGTLNWNQVEGVLKFIDGYMGADNKTIQTARNAVVQAVVNSTVNFIKEDGAFDFSHINEIISFVNAWALPDTIENFKLSLATKCASVINKNWDSLSKLTENDFKFISANQRNSDLIHVIDYMASIIVKQNQPWDENVARLIGYSRDKDAVYTYFRKKIDPFYADHKALTFSQIGDIDAFIKQYLNNDPNRFQYEFQKLNKSLMNQIQLNGLPKINDEVIAWIDNNQGNYELREILRDAASVIVGKPEIPWNELTSRFVEKCGDEDTVYRYRVKQISEMKYLNNDGSLDFKAFQSIYNTIHASLSGSEVYYQIEINKLRNAALESINKTGLPKLDDKDFGFIDKNKDRTEMRQILNEVTKLIISKADRPWNENEASFIEAYGDKESIYQYRLKRLTEIFDHLDKKEDKFGYEEAELTNLLSGFTNTIVLAKHVPISPIVGEEGSSAANKLKEELDKRIHQVLTNGEGAYLGMIESFGSKEQLQNLHYQCASLLFERGAKGQIESWLRDRFKKLEGDPQQIQEFFGQENLNKLYLNEVARFTSNYLNEDIKPISEIEFQEIQLNDLPASQSGHEIQTASGTFPELFKYFSSEGWTGYSDTESLKETLESLLEKQTAKLKTEHDMNALAKGFYGAVKEDFNKVISDFSNMDNLLSRSPADRREAAIKLGQLPSSLQVLESKKKESDLSYLDAYSRLVESKNISSKSKGQAADKPYEYDFKERPDIFFTHYKIPTLSAFKLYVDSIFNPKDDDKAIADPINNMLSIASTEFLTSFQGFAFFTKPLMKLCKDQFSNDQYQKISAMISEIANDLTNLNDQSIEKLNSYLNQIEDRKVRDGGAFKGVQAFCDYCKKLNEVSNYVNSYLAGELKLVLINMMSQKSTSSQELSPLSKTIINRLNSDSIFVHQMKGLIGNEMASNTTMANYLAFYNEIAHERSDRSKNMASFLVAMLDANYLITILNASLSNMQKDPRYSPTELDVMIATKLVQDEKFSSHVKSVLGEQKSSQFFFDHYLKIANTSERQRILSAFINTFGDEQQKSTNGYKDLMLQTKNEILNMIGPQNIEPLQAALMFQKLKGALPKDYQKNLEKKVGTEIATQLGKYLGLLRIYNQVEKQFNATNLEKLKDAITKAKMASMNDLSYIEKFEESVRPYFTAQASNKIAEASLSHEQAKQMNVALDTSKKNEQRSEETPTSTISPNFRRQ